MSGNAGVGTGHGTSISFTVLTGTFLVRSITLHEESGQSPDISHLGSTNNVRTYIPPDLMDIGTISLELLFDTDTGMLDPTGVTRDTGITITFPIRVSGNTTNATLAGPGWLTRKNYGNLQSNVEQVATVDIQWETRPTYTVESA